MKAETAYDFDISTRIEPIKLVNKLQHCSLHLVIASLPIIMSSTSDSVHLVKEDDAGLLGPRHLEQLTHHPGSLTYILLD